MDGYNDRFIKTKLGANPAIRMYHYIACKNQGKCRTNDLLFSGWASKCAGDVTKDDLRVAAALRLPVEKKFQLLSKLLFNFDTSDEEPDRAFWAGLNHSLAQDPESSVLHIRIDRFSRPHLER